MSNLSLKRDDAFIKNGFCNWEKAKQTFKTHAKSKSHNHAVEKVTENVPLIDAQLCSQTEAEQKRARACLEVIFTSVMLLARQGLALRGHTDGEGNFLQMLRTRARDVKGLSRWLGLKTTFTSPTVQNEILQMLSKSVVAEIADKIRIAKQFAVIADGTQDASRKEQLSLCFRYIDSEFEPHEVFLGLYEPPNTTGATVAECIIDTCIR